MNVVIAGGTGLIGTALSKSLLEDGHKVTIISRKSDRTNKTTPEANIISWKMDSLISSIEEADAVVNLAGASIAGSNPLAMRWTAQRKTDIKNSRIWAGTVLSEAIQHAVKIPDVLIQASAIGFYGNIGDDVLNESSAAGKDFLAEVCQAWETSTMGIEDSGVRRSIIRIGLVFSQKGGLFQFLKLPFVFFLGGPIGNGQQYLSWIHIDDLISAIRFLLDNEQTRAIYNVTSPEPVQNKQFADQIGKSLNKPSWFTIPAFVLKLSLGEAATLALDGRAVYPKRLLESGFVFKYDKLSTALLNLRN